LFIEGDEEETEEIAENEVSDEPSPETGDAATAEGDNNNDETSPGEEGDENAGQREST
jgi:hypothetical protein